SRSSAIGKIASMASPMNFRISPPRRSTGSAMQAKNSSSISMISVAGRRSASWVKPLRSQYHSAAATGRPSPRLTLPSSRRLLALVDQADRAVLVERRREDVVAARHLADVGLAALPEIADGGELGMQGAQADQHALQRHALRRQPAAELADYLADERQADGFA